MSCCKIIFGEVQTIHDCLNTDIAEAEDGDIRGIHYTSSFLFMFDIFQRKKSFKKDVRKRKHTA